MAEKKNSRRRPLEGAFAPESNLIRVLNSLSDMIILNLLCILCSLPIITAGASIAACCQYSNRILKESDSGVLRGFFDGFRENFKQATPIWLGIVFCAGVLYTDNWILVQMDGTLRTVLRTVVLIGGIILQVETIYVFPLIVVFENTRRACTKNALLIALRHLPQTVLMFVISMTPVWIICLLPGTAGWMLFFMLVIGLEGIIMANTLILEKIFPLYMPKQ